MDNPNISPVTEVEVRNLMERICTTIVAHSQQDQVINTLSRDVDDLRAQNSRLTETNQQLRKDLKDSEELARMYEDERGNATKAYETEKDRANHLQGLILARDSTVQGLNQQVSNLTSQNSSLQDTVRAQESRIDTLLRRNDELVNLNDDLSSHLSLVTTDAAKAHEDLRKLQETFKSVFNQVQPDTAEPEQVQTVKEPERNTVGQFQSPAPAPEMKPVVQEDVPSDHPWKPANY